VDNIRQIKSIEKKIETIERKIEKVEQTQLTNNSKQVLRLFSDTQPLQT
jgi:hypothetical protein